MSHDAEDGVVAGLEGLAFGVLIFVFGLLLVMTAWNVIDTKIAVSAAAREAVRTFVEAPAVDEPDTVARADGAMARASIAAESALVQYGQDTRLTEVRAVGSGGAPARPMFDRCAEISIEVRQPVDFVLPFAGTRRLLVASATASEVVDPLRSGLVGEAACVG